MIRGGSSLLVPLAALALVACGFTPMHAERPAGETPGLAVAVDTIPGSAGFVLRERLVERLGTPSQPDYRLSVALELRDEGAAVTREDITTRYIVTGTASYRLQPLGRPDEALEGAVSAQTAYSAPADDTASAFASRAAALDARERVAQTLADRIVLRLSVLDWLGDEPAAEQ